MAMIRSYQRLANILTINRGRVQLKSEGAGPAVRLNCRGGLTITFWVLILGLSRQLTLQPKLKDGKDAYENEFS